MGKTVVIVGGGIIGLATALKLSARWPKHQVIVLEKESAVGAHQSSHNSGVLHAGLYYKPGSYKAQLAVRGIREMKRFCEANSIAHETCGKLVVATNNEESTRLVSLLERGKANGLVGLRRMNAEEMLEIEPHVKGVAALHVPEEGIVDYKAVCEKLSELLRARGVLVQLDTQVLGLARRGKHWIVGTSKEAVTSDLVLNAAGLYCDKINRMSGGGNEAKIIPFRGEYFKLRAERQHLVRHLIYPVPDPVFPFLGVHFTRLVRGGVEAGPNAVLAFAREGYSMSTINPSEFMESLCYPGLWRFLKKHSKMCWVEFRQSLSKALFCRALQKLVPDIRESDLSPGGAGVRAQSMSLDGTLVQDFTFEEQDGILHLLNAPSPGATASLAIGEEVVNRFESQLAV